MQQSVLVAGGSGNLGERIIKALLERGAEVRAVVRHGSDPEKLKKLETAGVQIFMADMLNTAEITNACTGVSCVVSALQGLRDVIVDTQKVLLDSAIAAGVLRFIPSDYSLDFTRLKAGENRNFDLRREFHQYLHTTSIAATSIFNGAFADILTYNIPVLNAKKKTVGYWGDTPDWKLDFTTMDETAAFTAAAALDAATPPRLCIASFQASPGEFSSIAGEITKSAFNLIHMGSVDQLAEYNQRERFAHPEGETQLNPAWQSGQYLHDMFSVQHETLDNRRYPDLKWTSAAEFLTTIL